MQNKERRAECERTGAACEPLPALRMAERMLLSSLTPTAAGAPPPTIDDVKLYLALLAEQRKMPERLAAFRTHVGVAPLSHVDVGADGTPPPDASRASDDASGGAAATTAALAKKRSLSVMQPLDARVMEADLIAEGDDYHVAHALYLRLMMQKPEQWSFYVKWLDALFRIISHAPGASSANAMLASARYVPCCAHTNAAPTPVCGAAIRSSATLAAQHSANAHPPTPSEGNRATACVSAPRSVSSHLFCVVLLCLKNCQPVLSTRAHGMRARTFASVWAGFALCLLPDTCHGAANIVLGMLCDSRMPWRRSLHKLQIAAPQSRSALLAEVPSSVILPSVILPHE